MVDVEASSHGGSGAPGTPAGHVGADAGKPSYAWTTSAFYRCLMLEDEALLACREALRAAVEFGTILAWFYVADRTSIIAPGTKARAAHCAAAVHAVVLMLMLGIGSMCARLLACVLLGALEWRRGQQCSWTKACCTACIGECSGPVGLSPPLPTASQPVWLPWQACVSCVLIVPASSCLPRIGSPSASEMPTSNQHRFLPLPLCVQSYSRDVFVFIFVVMTAVAGGYTLKQHRTLLLHRTQTEEWKGWMQVRLHRRRRRCCCCRRSCCSCSCCARRAHIGVLLLCAADAACGMVPFSALRAIQCTRCNFSAPQVLFLLYHYFNAKEIYNAIRVFIAAYVWMTGFGALGGGEGGGRWFCVPL